MQRGNVLEKIEKEVKYLKPEEQLSLAEKIIHQLRLVTVAGTSALTKKKSSNTTEVYGLGRAIWGNEDAQEYVNGLRKDRI